MNSFDFQSINALAERWVEIIWAISWQFCVLGLAVLLIHWSLRRAPPNWRYWLWQILAIKLLLMPFWTAAAPWPRATAESLSVKADSDAKLLQNTSVGAGLNEPNGSVEVPLDPEFASNTVPDRDPTALAPSLDGPVVSTKLVATKVNTRPPAIIQDTAGFPASGQSATGKISRPLEKAFLPFSWQSWLMLTWLLGVSWYVLRIVWQGAALSRRLRDAQPAAPQLLQQVRDAAVQLGLTRIPEVRILEQDLSPFVCGLWRARLIMPRAVSESFTPEQLNLVLLHELAHVRRRDLLWGWIPEIGRVGFFFHPLAHVVCNQIRFERELACDQLAMISSGRDAATYADTLVKVAGQFSSPDTPTFAAVESLQN
ncbi:MAG: blaR [Planctomycetaceae bacterium]|nr:blaR [Planctomycetaceae bacterium]